MTDVWSKVCLQVEKTTPIIISLAVDESEPWGTFKSTQNHFYTSSEVYFNFTDGNLDCVICIEKSESAKKTN